MNSLLELGLDVTEIHKALDDLTTRFEKSMDKNAKATTKMGAAVDKLGKGMKSLLGVFGISVGVGALAKSFLSAGESYDASVDKFIAGSERLKKRTNNGDVHGAAAATVANAEVEDFWEGTKQKGAIALSTVIKGWKSLAAAVKGGSIEAGIKKQDEQDNETDKNVKDSILEKQLGAQIAAKEDEIAKVRSAGATSIDAQNELLKKQGELGELIRSRGENHVRDLRHEMNAGLEMQGDSKKAARELSIEQEKVLDTAMATTDAITHEVEGRKGVADIARIQLKYELQILDARKAGNSQLEQELLNQRKIELATANIAEHRKTPQERLDERAAARKRARDKGQTTAAEKEMGRRAGILENQARNGMATAGGLDVGANEEGPTGMRNIGGMGPGRTWTPGSEMDRFMSRQNNRVGATPNGPDGVDYTPILQRIESALQGAFTPANH